MPKEIRVPRLGWSMEEGVLVRWLKRPGEEVAEGEPLFELEGEKAVQEIGSLDAGTLFLHADAPAIGSTVLVGTVLGYLLAPGEAAPDCSDPSRGATTPTPRPPAFEKPLRDKLDAGGGPAARRLARKHRASVGAESPRTRDVASRANLGELAPGHGRTERSALVASPRARRVARELGIDWKALTGTGDGGRVREADVRAAARSPRARSETPLANLLTPRRNAIAKRLRHSRDRTVPVTLTTTADVTNLVALRRQFKASEAGVVPAYSDLAAVLAARVLRRHPLLAVRWDDEQSALHSVSDTDFHIGIAVDTAAGLLVPVVRDVLRKSLVAIATETRQLAEQARTGRLTGSDIQTPVLTVSNLGSYGIDAFTPVINYPEISILGLGAVRREPVAEENDQILIRDRMVLSLTFDHAAVDGAPAAAFLADIASAIANPAAHLLGD